MRKADIICAACVIALAVVVMVEGVRLGIGWGTDGPRPGFFPFWLGVGLGASGLVVLGQAGVRRAASAGQKRFVGAGRGAPVLKVLLPAIGMVLLTQVLGLYVAGILYMGAYMRWIGRHSWLSVVLVSLAIPVATFLVFEKWFLVPMPKGPIEAWLGY